MGSVQEGYSPVWGAAARENRRLRERRAAPTVTSARLPFPPFCNGRRHRLRCRRPATSKPQGPGAAGRHGAAAHRPGAAVQLRSAGQLLVTAPALPSQPTAPGSIAGLRPPPYPPAQGSLPGQLRPQRPPSGGRRLKGSGRTFASRVFVKCHLQKAQEF